MFAVVILVCVHGTSPVACAPETAIHRIIGPPVQSELECMRNGQMFAASLAIVHENDVVKVVCQRKHAFAVQK